MSRQLRQEHFAAIRSQIDAFDEEKKGALERLMTFCFTVAAYVGPFLVALVVAQEIADTYSVPWPWGNIWSVSAFAEPLQDASVEPSGSVWDELCWAATI